MKAQNLLLTNLHFQDLNPIIAGRQNCPPGHRFGPHVRKYTLLHYVLAGKGTLYTRGQIYPVRAGQMFVILPGEVTTYEADLQDPWRYCWVGFDGNLSRRFSELPPVLELQADIFTGMFPGDGFAGRPECWVAGGLHRLYGTLFSSRQTGNLHVKRAENRIRTAYMEPITVESIARSLNLDRRYLSRLFKTHTGQTVQQYLIGVRMEEARSCLEQGSTVQSAAMLCGYEDVSNFSKMYKKHFGIPPKSQRLKQGHG